MERKKEEQGEKRRLWLMMGLLWMMSAPFVSMTTPCHAKLTVDIGYVVLQLFLFFFFKFINLSSVSWNLVQIHSTGFVYFLMPLVAEKMCCLTTKDLESTDFGFPGSACFLGWGWGFQSIFIDFKGYQVPMFSHMLNP